MAAGDPRIKRLQECCHISFNNIIILRERRCFIPDALQSSPHSLLICFPCPHLSSRLSSFFFSLLVNTVTPANLRVWGNLAETATQRAHQGQLGWLSSAGCSLIFCLFLPLVLSPRGRCFEEVQAESRRMWALLKWKQQRRPKKERAASTEKTLRLLVLHAAEGVVLH